MRCALWGGDTIALGEAFLLEFGLLLEAAALFGEAKKSSSVVFCLLGVLLSPTLASSSAATLSSKLSSVFSSPRESLLLTSLLFSFTFSGVLRYCQSPLTGSMFSKSTSLPLRPGQRVGSRNGRQREEG